MNTIVLLGRKAQLARDPVSDFRPDARVLEGWHPSPLAMNRDPARRHQLLDVLREAAAALAG